MASSNRRIISGSLVFLQQGISAGDNHTSKTVLYVWYWEQCILWILSGYIASFSWWRRVCQTHQINPSQNWWWSWPEETRGTRCSNSCVLSVNLPMFLPQFTITAIWRTGATLNTALNGTMFHIDRLLTVHLGMASRYRIPMMIGWLWISLYPNIWNLW